MPSHDAAQPAALGRDWIAAWNSHDLERVLAIYARGQRDDLDRIPALGFDPSGTLRGKDKIRMYWAKALTLLPDLHFELIDAYVSPDSMVVFHHMQNRRGAKCEYLRLNAAGKVVHGSVNHLAH